MPPASTERVCPRFSSTCLNDAVERLEAACIKGDPCVKWFFDDLASCALDGLSDGDLASLFCEIAEKHICGGDRASSDCDLVRVVSAVNFLWYYSKKFAKTEEVARRARIEAEIRKLHAILMTVTAKTLTLFLDSVLNLNGRLRRIGYPLWLTTAKDVADCSSFADYHTRLALGEAAQGPGFRFRIGLGHVGTTPNVRAGEPDHDPNQTMTVHIPSAVDGMHDEQFVPGGRTAGGAVEYVSKLDNTEAIDEMEIIE